MNIFSVAKSIKVLCAYRDTNIAKLADKLGLSKESIYTQCRRDNFRVNDVIKLADALGYDVEINFVDRESGQIVHPQ